MATWLSFLLRSLIQLYSHSWTHRLFFLSAPIIKDVSINILMQVRWFSLDNFPEVELAKGQPDTVYILVDKYFFSGHQKSCSHAQPDTVHEGLHLALNGKPQASFSIFGIFSFFFEMFGSCVRSCLYVYMCTHAQVPVGIRRGC